MTMLIFLLFAAFLAIMLVSSKRRLRDRDLNDFHDDELEYYIDEPFFPDSNDLGSARTLPSDTALGCPYAFGNDSAFEHEGISFSAFSPELLHPGCNHELVVWAHKPKDWLYVSEKSQRLAANRVAGSREGLSLSLMDIIVIQMIIDEVQVDE